MRFLDASLAPQYPLQEPFAGCPTCAGAATANAAATSNPRKADRVMRRSAPCASRKPSAIVALRLLVIGATWRTAARSLARYGHGKARETVRRPARTEPAPRPYP